MSINYPDVYEKDEIKDIVEDRRIVRMVRDFMFRSREYRRPYLRLARRSRDAYECWQMQGRSLIQRANLKLPYGYTIIENQTPQIVDIFARHDYVMKFEGHEPTDYMWESLISDFHKFQLREMGFKAKFPQVVKSMLLDGTAICKVPYIYREMETVERVMEMGPRWSS